MNAARTNVFYFSLYYCENTGCLHCNSEKRFHRLQRGPFTKRRGRFFYIKNQVTNCQIEEKQKRRNHHDCYFETRRTEGAC